MQTSSIKLAKYKENIEFLNQTQLTLNKLIED